MRLSLAAAALAALLAGCGDKSNSAPAPSATPSPTAPATVAPPKLPALCEGTLTPRVVGQLSGPAISELSGLTLSRSGTLWTHNDSGDVPRVIALSRQGRVLREVTLEGAEAIDWEDIAARGRTLYVGDIGDNLGQRTEIAVYRFQEPKTPSVIATKLVLRYPDRPHDAEALLVDPRNGSLAIVTKDFGGASGVYTARRNGGTMRHAATLALGIGQAVTAGSVSGDGRTVVLRSYDRAFVYQRRGGESLARALRRKPCVAHAELLDEGQGESIALTRDGRAFYTVPEGPNPALRRYGG